MSAETKTIVDIEGNSRVVKLKLPWGKERQILKIIGDVAQQIPARLDKFETTAPGLALLNYITTEAPEKVTDILSIILNISPTEIEEKYDGDAVIDFTLPFLAEYLQKWGKRLEIMPLADLGGFMTGTSTPGVTSTPTVESGENE